jgi:hypothetical protein
MKTILGSFEIVSMPEFGLENVVAKVDTGAFSGAMHCTDIKLVRRGVRRKQYLLFSPAGIPELRRETDKFVKRHVRSATGHRVRRYLVHTIIEINGKQYPIEIGLSDRSDMKRQILLGRRFLREHQMLVDVSQNVEYDDEGELFK